MGVYYPTPFRGVAPRIRLRPMNWTMPQPTLRVVAWLIGLGAVSSFAFGIYNAQPPGRLPGEGPRGKTGTVIQAMEATPLSQERIEGPPPPPELTPEEKARLEEEKKAKEEAARLARLEAEQAKAAEAATVAPPPVATPAPTPAPPPVEKAPQPEDPPF